MNEWRIKMIQTLKGLLENMSVSDFSSEEEDKAVKLAIDELEKPTCCMCGEAIKYHHCYKDST